MVNAPSSIEVLPAPPGRVSQAVHRPPRRRGLLVFVLTFVLCAAAGLAYTYLRPALYRSTATLLIAPQRLIDQDNQVAQNQFVAVQRQLLTSRDLLDRLPVEGDPRQVFSVQPIDNTWMLELQAIGHDRELLPRLIDQWIELYQAHFEATQVKDSDTAGQALRQQVAELGQRVEDKRREVRDFQQRHDIISLERDENQVTARIKSLNDSLNQARQEQATTGARLESLREAMTRGEDIGRAEDLRILGQLEAEATRLRSQLKELSRRFTPAYMELDPAVVAMTERLREIEGQMGGLRQAARQRMLAEAGREADAARRNAATLEQELAGYQQTAQTFSGRFQEYQALQEELAHLEGLHRQAQERLVNEEVVEPDQSPRISILDRSGQARQPFYPDYGRDTLVSLGVALGLALLALLLYRYRHRSVPAPAQPAAPERPSLFAILDPRALGLGARPEPQPQALPHQEVKALPAGSPRELSRDEAEGLLEVANDDGRRLVAVLLSGLTLEEAAALHWADIDLQERRLRVPGHHPRQLPLNRPLERVFEGQAHEPEEPVWPDAQGEPLEGNELEALLTCLAHDAGLERPEEVDAAALRHSYLAWLVRQGVRLAELERLAGRLSPSVLAGYGALSPPGRGLRLEQVEITHPALRLLAL